MHWYWKVIKHAAVFRLAAFRGRARRREFWMFHLVHLLIGCRIYVFAFIIGSEDDSAPNAFLLWLDGI